jgi:hypothetical protein
MPRLRSGAEQPWRRETGWRIVDGPSGRVVVCASNETANTGFEVRVGYAAEEILRSERLTDCDIGTSGAPTNGSERFVSPEPSVYATPDLEGTGAPNTVVTGWRF